MADALFSLTEIIRMGLDGNVESVRPNLQALFGSGGRYQKRYFDDGMIRDALSLAGQEDDARGVPFAALINPDNPRSGPYGGACLAWFPTKEFGSLLALATGTRGLSPDEGILTRPGHRRRITALRQYLSKKGLSAWSKPDPAALGVPVPEIVMAEFPGFENSIRRYKHELYCVVHVWKDDPEKAQLAVRSFLDLYAHERQWQVLTEGREEYEVFQAELLRNLFATVSADSVNKLLRNRRFVVLQGPPGTGKTRLAEEVRRTHFEGQGMTVQFHPAVTYEDFVVGLSPDPQQGTLRFEVRPGWLLQAAKAAQKEPYLLVIDEINRADLGKVLGEGIYLFEPGEVGGEKGRTIQLSHAVDGNHQFSIPENLYILATMNTADRSIAGMDIAIRRRFAFVDVMPDQSVIDKQQLPLASEIFKNLCDVFIEHAPIESLNLLPGHAYFLAASDAEFRERVRYELIPLLDEYIREGYLGPARAELQAVRDAIEDKIGQK